MGSTTAAVEVGGEAVRLTSPDRVVFPQQGWTKLDVAHHFVTVAEGCLRGVYGRPTMMKRYMKSVDQPPIYHKRAPAKTPFETAMIRFPSQRPGRMNVPRTQADILRLVQLGCLDLHPWPVRTEDPDHPDELRLDFDPTPGYTFTDVKTAVMPQQRPAGRAGPGGDGPRPPGAAVSTCTYGSNRFGTSSRPAGRCWPSDGSWNGAAPT